MPDIRSLSLCGAVSLLALLVMPTAPATHDPIVPVMEQLAQNTQPGIRPGAWMEEPHPCTFAFVVEDQDGRIYITTAGHCVDFVGQRVSIREQGEFGTVVAFRDAGAHHDYALISIDSGKLDQVDPTMIGWGGPTGVYQYGGVVTQVKHYGWGSGTWYDHTTRCRTALAFTPFWDSETFSMFGTVLWGDSGSGSMTADGQALGINTHLDFVDGTSTGPRFDHVLRELGAMTGLRLDLVEGRPIRDMCALDD